jgi:hypothetical protein
MRSKSMGGSWEFGLNGGCGRRRGGAIEVNSGQGKENGEWGSRAIEGFGMGGNIGREAIHNGGLPCH